MNIKMLSTLMVILICQNFNVRAEDCPHLAFGQPKQSDLNFCRGGYAIGYNTTLKSADWVAYKLDKDLNGGVDRQDDFREDTDIPHQYRTTVDDYIEPIFDMGHLGNSESIDRSISDNSETFLMSNMVPQLPGHNRSIWKGLENRERKWANNREYVFVYTGPIYEMPIRYIGNKVPVPSSLWKIIYSPAEQKAIAYLIPHQKLKTAQLDKYLVSIDDIESITGLDFLSTLQDVTEFDVESETARRQWKR
jgi:endonuclease G